MKRYFLIITVFLTCFACKYGHNEYSPEPESMQIPTSIFRLDSLNLLLAEKKVPRPFFKAAYIEQLKLLYSDNNYLLARFDENLTQIFLLFDKKNQFWFAFVKPYTEDKRFTSFHLLDKNFIPIYSCHCLYSRIVPQMEIYRYNNLLIESQTVKVSGLKDININTFCLKDLYDIYDILKAKRYKEQSHWVETCKITDDAPVWEI